MEYTPGKMTDEQALEVLDNIIRWSFVGRRTNCKTIFSMVVLEALGHAYKALKEKIDGIQRQEVKNGNT